MNKAIQIFMTLLIGLFVGSMAFAAETAITPIEPSETASESVFTAVDTTNGNSIQNPAGDVILIIQNTHASDQGTATIEVQDGTVSYPGIGEVTKSSVTCTLDSDEECIVGPFPPIFWNDGNSNLIVTNNASGSLQIAPIKP